ncbi:hypothetical protein QUF80_09365 [Desulfococcaceae bacterium HSG8]|nr:hypothetical protein [Desulfococcaceae bacterium HSG8]
MPNYRKETGIETLRYICHTSDALSWKDMETKLIQAFDKDRKGDIMTIADELRMEGEIKGKIKGKIEGEIRGKIKMCQELMEKGFIHRELAEQKIAELSKKLENISAGVRMMSAGDSDVPDQTSA